MTTRPNALNLNANEVSGFNLLSRFVCGAFLCALFLGWVMCSGHAAESSKKAEEAKSPEVVISFQRFVTLYGERHAEFAISNATPNSLWFTGYGLESPIYFVEHLDGGRWSKKEMGWFCATGLDAREIPAHKQTTFSVLIEKSDHTKTMRVGISFSPQKKYSKEAERMYWSEKVLPPKGGV